MSVKDKVVVITGASSGIGRASAELLAKQGAKVVIGARREDRLKEIADQFGDSIAYRATDVSNHEDVQALVDLAVERFGGVDVLFNNAGVMPTANLSEDHRDEWRTMLDINIMGVLNGISAALPVMHQQGHGHILATDSVAGHIIYTGSAVYCGTKFAVRAIMDGLRQEEKDNHIRSTIVSPGAVDTELYKSSSRKSDGDALLKMWHKNDNSALRPEDLAETILYAIDTPERVNVSEILIRPSDQLM